MHGGSQWIDDPSLNILSRRERAHLAIFIIDEYGAFCFGFSLHVR